MLRGLPRSLDQLYQREPVRSHHYGQRGPPLSKEDGTIKDFTVSITVDATPDEAFDGINDVAKWWTENVEGGSEKPGDEFTVRFGDVQRCFYAKISGGSPGQKSGYGLLPTANLILSKTNTNGRAQKLFLRSPCRAAKLKSGLLTRGWSPHSNATAAAPAPGANI